MNKRYPSRREFMKWTGAAAAGIMVFPSFLASGASEKKRPNIVFIMSDDHAEQAISCYNDKLIHTPNIDRIATEGILFKNGFVTNSICAPSRAVLLTGLYSHKNGLRDNRDEFDGSQLTFPKLLQKQGYQTMMVGKWHLKTDPTGFDHWDILVGQGQYYNPVFIENGERKNYTGYTTDIITDKAIETLESRDPEKPFCIFVHHKAPHRNWMPDTRHLDKFADKKFPLPDTLFDDYKTREETAGHADMRIEDMYLSFDLKLMPEHYEKETGSGGNLEYAKTIEETWKATLDRLTPEQRKAWDEHYDRVNREFKEANLEGRELLEWKYQSLLDYLDDNRLSEDTLVVYTSDQGFYLGEHGWFDKRFMYEESLSMPLVMRYPREIGAGQVSDAMVMNLDFAPTFLDYAGVDIPAKMQGESLLPILRGKEPEGWRDSIYYHYYEYPHGWHNVRPHYGIRTEDYKLIHFYGEVDKWELFDLKRDPRELIDLYQHPDYREQVKMLKAELEKLRRHYGDDSMKSEKN